MTEPAIAYLYRGQWIAECPREYCANAEALVDKRGQLLPAYHCSNCQLVAPVTWPDPGFMLDVLAVVMLRPVPDTRNWYPKDHPTAVRFRLEHGQTLDDLRAENDTHGVAVH